VLIKFIYIQECDAQSWNLAVEILERKVFTDTYSGFSS